MSDARCSFYVRTAVDGGFTYERAQMGDPTGCLLIDPPLVGDLVYLNGVGSCVVVARSWVYPSWGSAHWPYNEPRSTVPPTLDLIVERQDGPFVDEIVREVGGE